MTSKRAYAVYDVFTETSYAGNPLAVVFDTAGLDTNAMQKIATEFNLSETVFILPASHQDCAAHLRIFMPRGELPFAGHPTVGGTIAICERENADAARDLILEEEVGRIRSSYSPGLVGHAQFELPVLPKREELMMSVEAAAAALGIEVGDIGFDNHVVTQWNAGKAYLCIPVNDVSVLKRVAFNEALWLSQFPGVDPLIVDCPYIYCRQSEHDGSAIQARMFGPHHGIPEDPATGSAAASLCGALQMFDRSDNGCARYSINQGVEMGRPSQIAVEIDVQNGNVTSARIGGHAVKVAEGFLVA
ncbi:MAG: PhzF family phenazine biosynthesis protein [Pseudomonadota bacterium]